MSDLGGLLDRAIDKMMDRFNVPIAPGVEGVERDLGDIFELASVRAVHEGSGAVGAYLDRLPKDRTVIVPFVVSDRLRAMLERRGFTTGEGHTVDEDEPVTTDDGHPSATPPDGPKSGVFDCPGVETLVVEKGATCRVCGFATTMVPADLPYPELVKLFDTHTCKEKPV